jgi:hypothetical protein
MCKELENIDIKDLTPVLLNSKTKDCLKLIVFFKGQYHNATFRPTVKKGKRQMTFIISCTKYKTSIDQAYRIK